MTDEEKAEDYLKSKDWNWEQNQVMGDEVKQAYLAGLAEGRKESTTISTHLTNCPTYQKLQQLEKEKCELLGIIQGKDTVIAELKEKIEKLKTEIESIRQKSVSRRSTINVLNTRLNSRLEQVERLKQENNKLWGENVELKKYKKICDNCKEDVVVQYRKLFNENEELEAQIEKMKGCPNCKNVHYDWREQVIQGICCKCRSYDKWELRK